MLFGCYGVCFVSSLELFQMFIIHSAGTFWLTVRGGLQSVRYTNMTVKYNSLDIASEIVTLTNIINADNSVT